MSSLFGPGWGVGWSILSWLFPLSQEKWERRKQAWEDRFVEGDPDCGHHYGKAWGLPSEHLKHYVKHPNGVIIQEYASKGDHVEKCSKCGKVAGRDSREAY